MACAGLSALLAGSAGTAHRLLGARECSLRGRHQPRREAAHASHHPRSQLGPNGPALSYTTSQYPTVIKSGEVEGLTQEPQAIEASPKASSKLSGGGC